MTLEEVIISLIVCAAVAIPLYFLLREKEEDTYFKPMTKEAKKHMDFVHRTKGKPKSSR